MRPRMDDLVKQAMAKWPNVPHCYGWLGLDERGDWYMRDNRVQALGGFKEACQHGEKTAKGSRLQHEKLIAFINRNYLSEIDATGAEHWFFQNGPQRVYVELAATPYILRISADFSIESHTGLKATYLACSLDEAGRVYLTTDLGFGLVHTQDVHIAAEAIDQGVWSISS
jgi:Protein of unknown function (DUF2946)